MPFLTTNIYFLKHSSISIEVIRAFHAVVLMPGLRFTPAAPQSLSKGIPVMAGCTSFTSSRVAPANTRLGRSLEKYSF